MKIRNALPGVVFVICGVLLLVEDKLSFGPVVRIIAALLLVVTGAILLASARAAARAPQTPRTEPLPEPGPEIEALVRSGDVIPAIKRHRELYGSSLKEAKDAVDRLRGR